MSSSQWPPEGGGGSGVTSLNSDTGDITITAGSGINVGTVGNTITISNTEPGVSVTTVSRNSTYSVPSTNYNVLMSGASWSVTLPDATVYTTGDITLVHQGTSLSQVYTILTTGSQTVGGIASGNYALYTNSESLILTSNGSNWVIKSHLTSTGLISVGTITFTNGAPGTTSANNVSWYRQGANAIIQYTFIQTGAGTPGATMPYLIGLPTNLTFASTIVPDTTTGPELLNPGAGTAIIPSSAAQLVAISSGAGAMSPCVPIAYSTTTFRLSGYEIGNNVARGPYDFGPEGTDFTFAETSLYMNVTLIAPIAGWQP